MSDFWSLSEFSDKKYYQIIFVFSSGLFPIFIYRNSIVRKTFSKETIKPDPGKIYTGSYESFLPAVGIKAYKNDVL